MPHAVTLATTGLTTTLEYDQDNEYPMLSAAVDGLIEAAIRLEDLTMYCNEEGKLRGLPVNSLATILYYQATGIEDVIVGDVVFLGGVDEEGEHIPLPEDADLNTVLERLDFSVRVPEEHNERVMNRVVARMAE